MKPPSDRTRTSRDAPKKSASRQGKAQTDGGGGWNPEPASLREGETRDDMGHAARNLEQLRSGYRELLPDQGERVETPHQDYVVSSETETDGQPAVLLTTPNGTKELYRLRFEDGDPLLEYHQPYDRGRYAHHTPRRWRRRSRQVVWPGYEAGGSGE